MFWRETGFSQFERFMYLVYVGSTRFFLFVYCPQTIADVSTYSYLVLLSCSLFSSCLMFLLLFG